MSFTIGPRATKVLDIVVRCTNGAKRRVISFTEHFIPPSTDRILLSPSQRRLLRYRDRARRCGKHGDQNITEGVRVPKPLAYCLSGALQSIEPPTTPAKNIQVPGAWVNSPRQETPPRRSLAPYDPNEMDVDSSDDDESGVIKSVVMTDPCASCETPVEKSKWFNRNKPAVTIHADEHDQVMSDPSGSETEKLYPMYTGRRLHGTGGVVHGRVNKDGKLAVGSPQKTMMSMIGQAANAIPVSPISAFVSDNHEVKSIQRIWRLHRAGKLVDLPAFRATARVTKATRPNKRPIKPSTKPAAKLNPPLELSNQRRVERLATYEGDVKQPWLYPEQSFSAEQKASNEQDASVEKNVAEEKSSLLSSPPSTIDTPPNPVKRLPSKRVAFFKSPQTGGPVSRFQTYDKGSRINAHSSPINNEMYDGISALLYSPTFPEQLQQMEREQQRSRLANSPNSVTVEGTEASPPSAQVLSPDSIPSGPVASSPESASSRQVAPSPESASSGQVASSPESASDDVDPSCESVNLIEDSSTPKASSDEGNSDVVPTQPSPATVPTSATPVLANTRQAKLPANPVTPDQITKGFRKLGLSGRRVGLRSAAKVDSDDRRRIRREKEEAAAAARKKQEAIEARKQSGGRRVPIGPVIEPLSSEWDRKVDQALARPFNNLPVAKSVSGVDIPRHSLGKLLPQPNTSDDQAGWLSDDIIAAYLEIIVAYGLTASGVTRHDISSGIKVPTMHAFNSFFYKNLSEKGPSNITRWTRRAKINGKNLLEVERVFIPCNLGDSHWTLMVVSPKYHLIEYFDSFHGLGTRQVNHVKEWLKEELGKDLYNEEEWRVVTRAGPRQNNNSDCGVFVSTTAKMVMLGIEPTAYSYQDIPTQRRRIVAELLNCGFEGELAPNVVFEDDD